MRALERIEGQGQDFELCAGAAAAIDFCAELERLARGVGLFGTRMQHRAAVAEAGHAFTVEQVSVNAGDLLRGIGTHTERTAGQQIDHLEGLQIQRFAGAGQQGVDMLYQRRHHQLVAVAARSVQQGTPVVFNQSCLRRQHISDMVGKYPGGHWKISGLLKTRFYKQSIRLTQTVTR